MLLVLARAGLVYSQTFSLTFQPQRRYSSCSKVIHHITLMAQVQQQVKERYLGISKSTLISAIHTVEVVYQTRKIADVHKQSDYYILTVYKNILEFI